MEPKRDVAADRAMCEAATPGPWSWKHSHSQGTPDDDEMSGLGLEVVGPPLAVLGDSGYSRAADARLMAESREALPCYVEAVDKAASYLITWYGCRECHIRPCRAEKGKIEECQRRFWHMFLLGEKVDTRGARR
jgi:hypothetical protein